MTDDRELRVFPLSLEIRAEEGQPPTLEGYAAVYNAESVDLGGFTEIIEPGFFENVLDDDVRSLWNHNPDMVLGRTRAGTLSLSDDGEGLRISNQLPDNSWGRDALVSIQRGDVDQMSFGFTVRKGGDEWHTAEGRTTRTLKRGGCAALYDVSPVTYPAYPQTSVQARARAQALQQVIPAEDDGRAAAADAETPEAATVQARHAARRRQLDILKRR